MSAILDSLLDRERLADIAFHDAALAQADGRVVVQESKPEPESLEESE